MKYKKLFFVPAGLIIISIITSILAFNYSNDLEKGSLYFESSSVEVTYDGDYFAVIGNLQENEYTIQVESLDEYLHITTRDATENIMKDFYVTIAEVNQVYDKSIIQNIVSTTPEVIDELNDYIFTVQLDSTKTYRLELETTNLNTSDDLMDIVLVNIPEQLLNMQSLMESISFSTLIFSLISFGTILAIIYIKKD